MIKCTLYKLTLLCFLVFLITSCKSTKTITSSSGMEKLSEMKYLKEVISNAPTFETFSSKMRLTVDLNGKETMINGSLKMKRNEIIQISIAPILGIEVARIEITKDSMLVLDRINKQYLYAPVSMLSFLADGDIDFYTLQSLFYNELFLPGKKEVGVSDLSAFTVQEETDKTLIRIKRTKNFDYCFTADSNVGLLVGTEINVRSKYQLSWKYSDFKAVDNKSFPARMNISLNGAGKPLDATIDLSKMETGKGNIEQTSVSRKYRQIDKDELLKLLFKL